MGIDITGRFESLSHDQDKGEEQIKAIIRIEDEVLHFITKGCYEEYHRHKTVSASAIDEEIEEIDLKISKLHEQKENLISRKFF